MLIKVYFLILHVILIHQHTAVDLNVFKFKQENRSIIIIDISLASIYSTIPGDLNYKFIANDVELMYLLSLH